MGKLLKNFVGIDISKTWFDAAVIKTDHPTQIMHSQFSQTPAYQELKRIHNALKEFDIEL